MCTSTCIKPELHTATKDIVVYKMVDLKYGKPFMGIFKRVKYFIGWWKEFKYLPNVVYTTTLDEFKPVGHQYPASIPSSISFVRKKSGV